MRILITGAHFTPAVATIEQLRKMDDAKIVYVGRKNTLEGDRTESVESKVLPSLGVKFIPIIAGRLQRSLTIFTLFSLFKIPIGLLQAFFIVLTEQPDVILSFGGYVAVPIVAVGWLFSIPVIIHEQALVAGLANRVSSIFADKIAISFQDNDLKDEKIILTGNPIRRGIIETSKNISRKRAGLPTILVMGGNQGSHVINLAVEKCLDQLLKLAMVYHQTGDSKYKDYERLEGWGRSGKSGGEYQVKKWIGKEYGQVLQKADLVISRSGINTLTELAFAEKPALLIPIPNKEQSKNAKYFEELGLARVLLQSKLSPEVLLENINGMLKVLNSLKEKAQAAKRVIVPDAAKRLALETILLGKKIEV